MSPEDIAAGADQEGLSPREASMAQGAMAEGGQLKPVQKTPPDAGAMAKTPEQVADEAVSSMAPGATKVPKSEVDRLKAEQEAANAPPEGGEGGNGEVAKPAGEVAADSGAAAKAAPETNSGADTRGAEGPKDDVQIGGDAGALLKGEPTFEGEEEGGEQSKEEPEEEGAQGGKEKEKAGAENPGEGGEGGNGEGGEGGDGEGGEGNEGDEVDLADDGGEGQEGPPGGEGGDEEGAGLHEECPPPGATSDEMQDAGQGGGGDFGGEASEFMSLAQDGGGGGGAQETPPQPMALKLNPPPVRPSEALLALAGQQPDGFLEGNFQGSESDTGVQSFAQENTEFAAAAAQLRSYGEDEIENLGLDPFTAKPYQLNGFNWESVQAVLQKVGSFAGTVADYASIIGTIAKVAGWVLSVLLPPVGAALGTVATLLSFVEIVGNVIAAGCSGINMLIDIVRLATTDDPQERVKFAARFADNLISTVGRAALAMAAQKPTFKEAKAAVGSAKGFLQVRNLASLRSAGSAFKGGLKGFFTGGGVGKGLKAVSTVKGAAVSAFKGLRGGAGRLRTAWQAGRTQLGKNLGRAGAHVSKGFRTGGAQLRKGVSNGFSQATRGLREGGRQLASNGRRGLNHLGKGFSGASQALWKGARSGQWRQGLRRAGGELGERFGSAGKAFGKGWGSFRSHAGKGLGQGGATFRRGWDSFRMHAGRGLSDASKATGRGFSSFGNHLRQGFRAGAKPAGSGFREAGAALGKVKDDAWFKDLAGVKGVGTRLRMVPGITRQNFAKLIREGSGAAQGASMTLRQTFRGLRHAVVKTKLAANIGSALSFQSTVSTLMEGGFEAALAKTRKGADPSKASDVAKTGNIPYLVGGALGEPDGRWKMFQKFTYGFLYSDISGINHTATRADSVAANRAAGNLQGDDALQDGLQRLRDAQPAPAPGQTRAPAQAPEPQPVELPEPPAPAQEAGDGASAAKFARLASIMRQVECYEQQMTELAQLQTAYQAAQARKQYLDALPLPEKPQPAAKGAIATMDEQIQTLQKAEEDAEAARVVFQRNLEKHTTRSANADLVLDEARQRREQLNAAIDEAEKEKEEIQQGKQGAQQADAKSAEMKNKGDEGKNRSESTKAEVSGVNPQPKPEPKEDVPWYRIDKHVVNAAKAAWNATVGRALRYIGERWNRLKQKLTGMIMEFVLGLVGADDLAQQVAQASEKADKNLADNQDAKNTLDTTQQEVQKLEEEGRKGKTEAEEAMQAYADLVVEAEETKKAAQTRRQHAEQWRDDMKQYVDQFQQTYGTSFSEATKASSESWGQEDPSPTIEAIENHMEQLRSEYDSTYSELESEAQQRQEQANQDQSQAQDSSGQEQAPEPEPMMDEPMMDEPMMDGPQEMEDPGLSEPEPDMLDMAPPQEEHTDASQPTEEEAEENELAEDPAEVLESARRMRGLSAQGRQAVLQELSSWNSLIASELQGVDLSETVGVILEAYEALADHLSGDLDALIMQLQGMECDLGFAREKLRDLATSFDGLTRQILLNAHEGYMEALDGFPREDAPAPPAAEEATPAAPPAQ